MYASFLANRLKYKKLGDVNKKKDQAIVPQVPILSRINHGNPTKRDPT